MLIDPIDHLPLPLGIRFRTRSISYTQSANLPSDHSREIYPVPKTRFIFVLLLREEGADSYSYLAEDGDYEGDLNFVTWISELGVINNPEYIDELNQLLFTE